MACISVLNRPIGTVLIMLVEWLMKCFAFDSNSFNQITSQSSVVLGLGKQCHHNVCNTVSDTTESNLVRI